MCIVALAWQIIEDMPLLLVSNRDEFIHRPTLNPHQWQDLPIYAGRDENNHGTWLGYHQKSHTNHRSHTNSIDKQNGKWASVLNFREGQGDKYTTSRGQLVNDFLTSELSPMAFAKQIPLSEYAGFNLILGNHHQAVVVNNRGYAPTALHAGLHVFSNGQPDACWFKCERLRQRMYQEVLPILNAKQTNPSTASFDETSEFYWQNLIYRILSDTQQAEDTQLPNTGVSIEIEKALSSICIDHTRLKGYGTRTQSILFLSNEMITMTHRTLT